MNQLHDSIILHYIRNTMAVFAISTLYQRADFFDFNLKCLLYTGLWSEEDWSDDKKKLYQIYNTSLFALAFIYVLITGIGAYASRDDVIVLLINLDKAIAAYNYIFKIIMFSFKRNHIRILISEIIYSGDHITKERKKIMGYQVVLISAMITSIIGGFQVVGQINGEMPVDAWLPFDPLKNMFSLFLAGQILGALFMIPFMYRAISIQGIVCSIIMYLCDQLVELQQRLKALNYTTERETVVRKEFKEIIKKHIRMMGYSKSLKDAFKEYFLVQNLAVTMELGLNALMVTFIGLEQKKVLVTFMAFLIVALFNAYIFCHLGNELMDQSFGMALAAYETNWTSWPVDMQKDLLVVITASQKSFKLTAGGIAYMTMQTYAQALYNGYSMFAVLRDVVN